MNISLRDLTIAYRKAKVDAWNRHDLNEADYLRYEIEFLENLKRFQLFLSQDFERISFTEKWLGGWKLCAKKLHKKKQKDDDYDMTISSDPKENFSIKQIDNIEYRLYAQPSVDFQLLSSLWIHRVGWKYERKLAENVYGNRLRPFKKRPNPNTSGSFKYYVPMFAKWKKSGIKALKQAFSETKTVVVSADAKSFFHSLKPDFLLDPTFLRNNGVRLTEEENELTRILIRAIDTWAQNTPLKTGLPVGLAASCVIANAALMDFDRVFASSPETVFYGRYVDDILFAFKNKPGINTRSKVWSYVAGLSKDLFKPIAKTNEETPEARERIVGIRFTPSYHSVLTETEVAFEGEKCRAFFLDGKTGPSFLGTLEEQIHDVTSEFRYLPRTIFDEQEMQSSVQKLLTKDGEESDNFRKVEFLTLRKRDLKELLREMNFLHRTLSPDMWIGVRLQFYDLIIKHLLQLPLFIDYAENDIRQVVSLATQCGDFAELKRLLDAANSLCEDMVKKPHQSRISGMETPIGADIVAEKWRGELFAAYARSINASINLVPDKEYNKSLIDFLKDEAVKGWFRSVGLIHRAGVRDIPGIYALHDLHANSYVHHLYRDDVRPITCKVPHFKDLSLGYFSDTRVLEECFDRNFVLAAAMLEQHQVSGMNASLPVGLLLPTRPVAERDLAWLDRPLPLDSVNTVFNELRGYNPGVNGYSKLAGRNVVALEIPNDRIERPAVALLNLKTDLKFVHDFNCEYNKDEYFERFKSIIKAFNQILAYRQSVDYIVLHELALPLRWFAALSGWCADKNISVISGTAYSKVSELCRNEAWLSLVRKRSNSSFKQAQVVCQEKERFARKEEKLLKDKGYHQAPLDKRRENHIVIRHGNIAFSALICAELTDIVLRARLRGLIDVLFVLAWNKDLHSFSSIIESTAIDLHAFVVHCNNNLYGDNRIRLPAESGWERDAVQLKGGDGEFFVVATLDIPALRKFQCEFDIDTYYAKDKDGHQCHQFFKPLPLGYENDMADYRKS